MSPLHIHERSCWFFSWARCCFSAEPHSYPTTSVASVYWRVSDPMVITHDRLSEIGPSQAESRDQPLVYLCLPIPSVCRTIKMEREYTDLPLSLDLPPALLLSLLKMLKRFFFPDSPTERMTTTAKSNCHTFQLDCFSPCKAVQYTK